MNSFKWCKNCQQNNKKKNIQKCDCLLRYFKHERKVNNVKALKKENLQRFADTIKPLN